MRRIVLLTIAFGIPMLWGVAPYGRTVGMMGWAIPQSFASTMLKLAGEVWRDERAINIEAAILPIVFLGLLTPLYPALMAVRLLTAPRRLATRRRWVWIVEGLIVMLLSPVACVVAIFAVSIFIPDAPSPLLYLPLWLLPGFAAASGLAAIVLGIAGRGGIARIILGEPAPR